MHDPRMKCFSVEVRVAEFCIFSSDHFDAADMNEIINSDLLQIQVASCDANDASEFATLFSKNNVVWLNWSNHPYFVVRFIHIPIFDTPISKCQPREMCVCVWIKMMRANK